MRTGSLPANMKKARVIQIIPCKQPGTPRAAHSRQVQSQGSWGSRGPWGDPRGLRQAVRDLDSEVAGVAGLDYRDAPGSLEVHCLSGCSCEPGGHGPSTGASESRARTEEEGTRGCVRPKAGSTEVSRRLWPAESLWGWGQLPRLSPCPV